MAKTLALDCNYLCHRAFFSVAKRSRLTYEEQDTGVIYGFLRDVKMLLEQHEPDHIVFCFDSQNSVRKKHFPQYKSRRKERYNAMSDAEQEAYDSMRSQIKELRKHVLPEIGYKNIWIQKGYEADDLLAYVAKHRDIGGLKILVTGDKDLYQLLTKKVKIWKPAEKKFYTIRDFQREWGFDDPSKFALVKAIAGCSTDDIAGLVGIGEKTAAKYVAGTLPTTTKAYQAIVKDRFEQVHSKSLVYQNELLVTLPFVSIGNIPGGGPVFYEEDGATSKGWKRVMREYGITSLSGSDISFGTSGVRK